MSIHDDVKAKIAAKVPCHAQGIYSGRVVSLYPKHGAMVWADDFGGGLSVITMEFLLIDQWIEGTAQVSPKTFTPGQLESRAQEHENGNGHGIDQGTINQDLADKIRAFANANPDLLANQRCPY